MNEELITKAKEVKSVEELLTLAKENNYPLTEEEAQNIFNQFHATGELSDDELDQVGGGCSTKVDGEEYTVVTNHTKCLNGQYVDGTIKVRAEQVGLPVYDFPGELIVPVRKDHYNLRETWLVATIESQKCGSCYNLEFKAGTGYCGKSRK